MNTARDGEFAGIRILVVEDDFHVARSLARALAALGCEVVGPASTVEDSCRLVKEERVDAALLDIRLAPGTSAEVARALLSKGAPFVFVSGFSNLSLLPEDLRGYPVLQKPIDLDTIRTALHQMLERRRR